MSTKKTYAISDLNSAKKAIRITVGTKSRVIVFEQKQKNSDLVYSTVSPAEQKAIEELKHFSGGMIKLVKTEPSTEKVVEDLLSTQGDAGSSELQKVIQEKDTALQNKEKELLDLKAQLEAFQKGQDPALDVTKAAEPVVTDTGSEGKKVTEYPEIKNGQEAKELLRKEPYLVNHQSLKTPEATRAKAEELGVSFPNWKD